MKLPLVSAMDPQAEAALRDLDAKMARFYNSQAVEQYYMQAHAANETWAPESYHHLVKRVCEPDFRVIDLGCGSAHAVQNLAECRIDYTGVDWSIERIAANRDNAPSNVRFISSPLYQIDLRDASFDVAFSFYVLEHLIWPQRFLAEMVRLVRPGGFIIIECPHFRLHHRIPSLPYGRTVAPLSQKIRQGRLLDATQHFFQRNVIYPRLIKQNFPEQRFPFLINLAPTCLSGVYYADNDAVYFVSRNEAIAELSRLGCIDASAELFAEWGRPIPDDPCVIAVRRQ